MDDYTRILNKTNFHSPDECWLWTAKLTRKGYGKATVGGKQQYAHRAVYELVVGPIPEGLQLDHLCRVRHCVNPDHLEPVTQRENFLRGESPGAIIAKTGFCQRGHSMDNPVTYKHGEKTYRTCRTCWNDGVRRRRSAPKSL